jgi:hypothetical protein
VPGLTAKRRETKARFSALRIEAECEFKFVPGLDALIQRAQYSRAGGMKIGTPGIELHGGVERAKCPVILVLARIYGSKPQPFVGIFGGECDDREVFALGTVKVPGPGEDAGAPLAHVHVVGGVRDFPLHNSHGRGPILRVAELANLRLPI